MMAEIQGRARVPITGLINNTNLQNETTGQDVIDGQKVIEEVSARTGIPIRAVVSTADVIEKLPDELKARAFPIERKMEIDWL